MALIACKECSDKVSDTAATCPHCGAAVAPMILAAAVVEPKKSGSTWWMWVLGIPVVLFIAMMILGSTVSDKKAAQYGKEAAIERECEKMMSDSALGNERRMTRQICDQMKEIARQEKK